MTEKTASTQTDTPLATDVTNQTSGAVVGASGGGRGGGDVAPGAAPPHTNRYGAVVASIIAIALLLGFWFWRSIGSGSGAEEYPVSWFIIIAAILGSIVNEPFRQGEPHQYTYGWIAAYISWKSAVSVVFAFLLYLMAIGGLIGGDMFPHFVQTTLAYGEHWNMTNFVTAVKPESYKDVAKILVWSFIAGYSEKFVPNLIGQILKTSEGKAEK